VSNAEQQVAAPSAVRPRTSHIPALDGIRGVGVFCIILFHYALFFVERPGAPGWLRHVGSLQLSLQMFFVLSGSLITYLLVKEFQATDTVAFKAFYLRRSRRLGPALAVLLPALVITELAWTGTSAASPLGAHPWVPVIAIPLFVGNWLNFTSVAGLGWMGPAWSIGVEEQFYAIWPVVLRRCLSRQVRRMSIYAGLAVTLILSVGIAELLFRRYGFSRTFTATPTQFPCIIMGVALGYEIAANPQGRATRLLRLRTVGLIGLVGTLLVAHEITLHDRYLLRGEYLPYAFFGCVLVGHCFVASGSESVVSRVLGWRPFELAGKLSYEAYLLHVIVIEAILNIFPGMHVYPMMVLDSVIIAVLAPAIYYLVEQPIRRRGWRAYLSRK
jgi:peptidoglycan/LPS O-acetylase OafA/YrhL